MSQIEPTAQVGPTQNTAPADDLRPARTPRAGELSGSWRLVTALTWTLVVVCLACVWKTSDQLGLSTWWLGPRGEPHSLVIQLLPFLPAVLMVLAALNHARYLPLFGLVASGLVLLTGLFDVVRFTGLGVLEIAIGVAAAVVSLVSLAGMYRKEPPEAVSDTSPGGV
jgi:hypothetical protein